MNTAIKAALVMVFIAVVALFMFFGGGGAMTGGIPSGGMPGSDGMRGIGWTWIPVFLPFGLGILLGWLIFGKRE